MKVPGISLMTFYPYKGLLY